MFAKNSPNSPLGYILLRNPYNRKCVLVSDFHYSLPEELIPQEPLADRAASRLLHIERSTGCCCDRQFRDFPELLRTDDLVVFNNTRVFPARLYGRRSGLKSHPVSPHNPAARDFLHGRIEVLLTRQLSQDPNEWQCLVRPGRKIAVGEQLFFGEHDELQAEVIARSTLGERCIRFRPVEDFFARIDQIGHVPLPPYISRVDSTEDRERYQTVYARERGSVAAPTAGLQRTDRVEEHKLHSEPYSIPPDAAAKINQALDTSRRIIAVGTTTVRTLEYAAHAGAGHVGAGSGEANIFIYPGYNFQVVNAMLTNFHLPQSTLLMLVSAFGGKENVLRAYDHAIKERYRFYSYGDCMFME